MTSITVGTTKPERAKLALYSELRQDGGNPSFFMELLAQAVETKLWEQLEDIHSFQELIESPPPQGLGSSIKEIETLISLTHRDENKVHTIKERMDRMRAEVRRLLTPELRNQGAPVGNKNASKKNKPLSQRFVSYGDNKYILARLKRDSPELAEKVIKEKIPITAAGKKAGIIKARQRFEPNNIEQTITQLKKYYDSDFYNELVAVMATENIESLANLLKIRLNSEEIMQLQKLLQDHKKETT